MDTSTDGQQKAIIKEKELEVEAQTLNLFKIQHSLHDIESTIYSLVKRVAADLPQAEPLFPELKKLQNRLESEQRKYLDLRKQKEEGVKQLRYLYRHAIEQYHTKRKINNSDVAPPVDLTRSQLLSGTMAFLNEEDDFEVFKGGSCFIPDSDITVWGGRNAHRNGVELLGTGPGANVYKGVCRGKDVAVKVFSKKLSERELVDFRTECEVLKSIVGHPHLLLFMGACIEEGSYKMVLEWARNGSLGTVFKENHKLSFLRKIQIMKEIALAIRWLHQREKSILHLNLKPSNVLFTNNWTVKIADYAIGHIKNFSDPSRIENKAAYYTAPELFLDETPTTKCDVYSYGILVWYLLMEGDPFLQTDMNQFKNKVVRGERPPLPPAIPARLNSIMERCWHKDATQRPSFAQLLMEDQWERIVTDAIAHGQEEAETMWKNMGKGTKLDVVPWVDFVAVFSQFLKLPNAGDPKLHTTVHWKCLAAILDADKSPHRVTHSNFIRFLAWFGPVRTGPTEGVAFLSELENLLRQDWFHGPIDATEASNRIVCSKLPNGFLLRFSAQESTYTMSFRDKTIKVRSPLELAHTRLSRKHFTDIPSLISYVERLKKQHHLTPVKYSRGYQGLFSEEIPSFYGMDPSTTAAIN